MNQVTVSVSDIPRAVLFYTCLGLRQIVSAPHYARFACPDGEATFSVHLTPLVQPETTTVYFECAQLDTQVQALGLQFDSELVDQPWLWRDAHLRDPDCNHIILFHAGEYRLNPPWRLQDT
ncbi:VOC family protein [Chitinimonas sp. BJB300]|uniref:VOC family protein n=1 Tax=Chitinimonas sp. BJB300 TaxID=1559339 RepID=UPI001C9087B7|nr:VOC family protein [Chitinimonas sp. BJB300]